MKKHRRKIRKNMKTPAKKHSFFRYNEEEILNRIVEVLEKGTSINVLNPIRKREFTYIRAMYYRLAISFTRLSYEVIANKVGKDHASVTHSMQNIWPQIESYREDLIEIYEQIVLGLDENEFAKVQVFKIQKELDKLNKTLENVKEEINKDYFSLQEKMTNIKKVAYNVSSTFDIK